MGTSDLTVLLVPPSGDTTLLAKDTCGGQVPTLTWCYSTVTDRDIWVHPGVGCRPHEGAHAAIGLVLMDRGVPVAMGIDRAYRAARPIHDDRRRLFLFCVEERAKVLYANIPGADAHAWVEGGNSEQQERSRYAAFSELVVEGIEPVEGLPFIMAPVYTTEDAVKIARWAAAALGVRVLFLRNGVEVPE